MAEFSSQEAMAKVKAFIQASVHDRDEAAVKALVTRASAEQGNFNPPPDAGEMQIDIGEPTLEGEEWVVPVTITNPKDSNQPVIKTPFTLTVEDDQYKINMLRTMERMFGGDMNAVMDGMVDALKGVGEAMAEGMKQAFDGLGEAMGSAMAGTSDSAQDQSMNRLPADASPEMIAIFNRFHEISLPDQVQLMREAVGSDQLTIYVDWDSFQGDAEAASKLTNKVLHNVRSAVCLSCSEDAARDLLREHLHEVVIHHIAYPEGKQIRLAGGRLEITTNLNDTGLEVGYHSSSEIIAAIRDGLDLDKGPAIDRLMSQVIPQLKEELRDRLDIDLDIDIDLASFTDAYDTQMTVRHIEQLERDLFRNFVYVLDEVNKTFPLANRLAGFRIEHVGSSFFRTLLARGSTIVMRINFTSDQGSFSTTDLETLLPGVVASVPDYSDPRAQLDPNSYEMQDLSLDAFAILSGYRDAHLPTLESTLQEAVGRGLDIEIDWASIGDDSVAANQLIYWGLNRVIGAARLIGLDPQAQQDLMETITGIRLVNVPSADMKQIEIIDGVLSLLVSLTDAEAGCFYEREIADTIISSMGSQWKPIIAEIRLHADYWEKQLAEPEHEAPATFAIDFAGFTSVPDSQKVGFALTQLREHGIDVLYYAITRLFENNPNFKQQFQKRVRRLIVNHVPDPTLKRLHGQNDAIVYQTALHDGYKGYFTIDEMVKRLPGIVAEMNDFIEDVSDAMMESQSMQAGDSIEAHRLARMATMEDEMDQDLQSSDGAQDHHDDASDANNEAFAQVRQDMENTLPNLAQSLAGIIGKPIPIEIDWDTLGNDPVAVGMLVNACLAPIMTGFMELSQNSSYRADAAKYIHEIILARAQSSAEQSLRLGDGTLIFTVFLDPSNPMPLPTDEAPAIFRGLIDYIRASGAAEETPAKPAAKKVAKAAASKKVVKKPAPPAPKKKPAAKKEDVKAKKPAPKKKGKGGK